MTERFARHPARAALFPLLCLCLALLLPGAARAHKVIASVFPSGSAIEGEIGFSSGDMAPDLPIRVLDEDGVLLGETATDANGFFLFTPSEPVTHIFRANLGAGHVAETRMEAGDVAAILRKGSAAPDASGSATPGSAATITYGGAAAPVGALPGAAASLAGAASVADSAALPGAPASLAGGGPAAANAPLPGAAATIAYAPTVTVAALTDTERSAIAEIVRDETRPLRQEIAAYKEKNDLQSILGGIGYIVGIFGVGFYVAARRKLREAA